MTRPRPTAVGLVAAALSVIISAMGVEVAAAAITAHLEGGFGTTNVRPLVSPTTIGATVSAGIGLPSRGRVRANVEFTATVGGDMGSRIPEGPYSGDRSLTTFLAGLEASGSRDGRGPFAEAGVGLGHATLSDATRSWQDFLRPDWHYPNRNFLGLALGAGVGYRTHGGPGPLRFVLACRIHGVMRSVRSGASAIALTTGLVY